MTVEYRDLALFGWTALRIWCKRRSLRGAALRDAYVDRDLRVLLVAVTAHRASRERCLQGGLNARPVAPMAREHGFGQVRVVATHLAEFLPPRLRGRLDRAIRVADLSYVVRLATTVRIRPPSAWRARASIGCSCACAPAA